MGLLNPRAIALQGIGTGVALFVAVQGLLPIAAETPTTGGGAWVSRPRMAVRPNPYREDEEILVIVAAALLMLNAQ